MGTIKKGRFIVGTHIFRPAPGARTEQKGYEQGILEDVEYVERLKDKHMEFSTYVLNLDTLKFEKNKFQSILRSNINTIRIFHGKLFFLFYYLCQFQLGQKYLLVRSGKSNEISQDLARTDFLPKILRYDLYC